MIAVVDYGLGNLASVRNALRAVGADVGVTSDRQQIERAAGVVLPGVGAARAGMERLCVLGLDGVVREVALQGMPLLGLCLGMQLLFDRSEEGDAECLGLIPGTVRLLRDAPKVPQIGWNQVRPPDLAYRQGEQEGAAGSPLRRLLGDDNAPSPYFYFVHSYVCVPDDPAVVAGVTDYGETFCSAAECGTIWGTQFHPERSGRTGLRLLRGFVETCTARQEA
jgi:glutamine amidotransferase